MQASVLGRVYVVGSGPGDPQFLTLRAVECLGRADLVLCDDSVDPRVLEFINPSAEVVPLGSQTTGEAPKRWPLEQVVTHLVDASHAGKNAVHVKDGDPGLFSHDFEEIEALRRAGVPVEIVPGVTAATAAAALAEIPITHAKLSSAVALATACQQREETLIPLDFGCLAPFPGTLVVYMPTKAPEVWTRQLLDGGRAFNTPVVLVAAVARPNQQVIRCSLGELAATVASHEFGCPVIAVIGPVAELVPQVGWYAARPLFGKRVLVTRPQEQSPELLARFRELGAEVCVQPAIEIAPPPHWQPVDEALRRLEHYHWLVFSSVNGVDYLIERLVSQGYDLRRLAGLKLAAIGPATAERLRQHHLNVALTPPEYRAESLAETLAENASGSRFLLARANRGREVLAERLRGAGAEVDQIVVYTSRDVPQPQPGIAEALQAGKFDWVTVTSSAIARALHVMFGQKLEQSRLASISPVTSQTLRELGYQPAAEAKEFTTGGLIDAILSAGAPSP